MKSNLKRDQIPQKQAENWRRNFQEEKNLTFNLKVPQIILKKETYKKLAGENENRVRIYLGLELEKTNDKNVLCAYAVSAFLLGSGDVYVDYETPVFKLCGENENLSNRTSEVIESIRRYGSWRSGEIGSEEKTAEFRKYIYPKAYLLTKFELHELFNVQNNNEIQIEFGISKTMNVMIGSADVTNRSMEDEGEVFDDTGLCPPHCDERSIYNR